MDLGYLPTPLRQVLTPSGSHQNTLGCQGAVCILLECILIFICRRRSIVVCRCAQLGLQAGDNDGGQRSFVRVQRWGLALVKYLRFCDFYRPQRSCGQGYVFTRVCDSVHGGGLRAGRTPPTRKHLVVRLLIITYSHLNFTCVCSSGSGEGGQRVHITVVNMSHFSYACKMQCPLNLVLENWSPRHQTSVFKVLISFKCS